MASTGRPALTRPGILAAAVELADRDGVAALSMRALASRLGVEAMSLYHHVANKEDLLDGMVDLVFAEFPLPRSGHHWRSELRERSLGARQALLRHRWAIGLMDSRSNPGPHSIAHHDAVLGCARSAGFSLALTGHAFALLDAQLYGFVLQEVSLPFESTEELQALGTRLLDDVSAAAFPHFTEYARDRAMQPGYAFGDEFEFGLDLILDGLERALAADHVDTAAPTRHPITDLGIHTAAARGEHPAPTVTAR